MKAFVPQAPFEALDEAVLHRLARRDGVPSTRRSCDQRRMADEVSSVPLSLTSAGSARPAAPSVPACPGHACGHRGGPQVLLAIYPQQLPMVGRHALPRQQIAQAPIAEPTTLRRQFAQPLP